MKSRLLLVLSVSVLAAAGFATPAVAEETTRYVALTGTDNPTCDKENAHDFRNAWNLMQEDNPDYGSGCW